MIGRRLGPYEILEKLGEGGMGEVYRARDTTLQRDVAIKVLPAGVAVDADRLARFRREAEVLASLNHPHIAQVYGVEVSSDGPALIMEYVDGRTLAAAIGGRAMAWDDALSIARQIALALEAAHERGVVHRDLKPANVKITDAGQVKVLDFGLAKAVAPDAAATRGNMADSPTETAAAFAQGYGGPGTQMGMILGTAAYMAPEQARGRPVDRRADIWAFGAVFYEMLTGRRAFEGENTTELLAAVVRDEPNWSRLPHDAVRAMPLLRRALQKDLRNRTQHIGDVRIALEELVDARADFTSLAPRPRSWWATLLGAGLLAAGVLAGVGIRSWLSDPQSALEEPFHSQVPYATLRINTGGNTVGALSPSGSHLAFAAPEGTVQWLWIREFKTGEVKRVLGSEGAFDPFWSPDGKHIAFFAEDKLASNAAPPVTRLLQTDFQARQPATEIARISGPGRGGRGGTWNAEGVILFRKGPGGIRRVKASGGAVTQVPLNLGSGRQGEPTFPKFLPDGQHFLFLTLGANGEKSVFVADLAGGEARPVLDSASSVEVVEGPAILFVRENRLLFQRLDPTEFRTIDEPSTVAEDVDVVPDSGAAQFTAGGNKLLYKRSSAGVRFQWTDARGGLVRDIESDAIRLGSPDQSGFLVAPKDDRLAVSRVGPYDSAMRIWILDLQSAKLVQETNGPHDGWPAWSPDGLRIAFRRGSNLIVKTVGANDEREIPARGGGRPLWTSKDEIVFARNGTLWFVNLVTGEPPHQRSVAGTVTSLEDISADGKLLAFTCDNAGRIEVCVARLDGTGTVTQISSAPGNYARWARTGTNLVYFEGDHAWMTTVSETSLSNSPPAQQFPLKLAASSEGVSGFSIARNGNLLRSLTEQPTALEIFLNWQSALPHGR